MSIRDLLSSKEDAYLGNGVDEHLIHEAETELGLVFANDYFEYLSTVGLAMCDGHELTGIGNADRTNVVSVTKQLKAFKEGIPADWYVIENGNMDGAVIWQDAKGHVFFNKRKEYDTLADFFADL
ncbi:MAG: SMI1/KNR4 family protein [Christensenellales bacterium]|jgi:hypothetical protein